MHLGLKNFSKYSFLLSDKLSKLSMNILMTVKHYITQHCNLSMEKAIAAERFALWKRACDALDDVAFIAHGLQRCTQWTPLPTGHR